MVPLRLRDATGVWDGLEGPACAGPSASPTEIAAVNKSFELDMTYSLEGDATLQLRASNGIPSGRQVSNCGGSKICTVPMSALGPSRTVRAESKSSAFRGKADAQRTCSELPCLTP